MTCTFEQGPIRPPSEARSLLLRLTRNCPWNRCTFCPVYKGTSFSVRTPDQVKHDIDSVHRHLRKLRLLSGSSGRIPRRLLNQLTLSLDDHELPSFYAAYHWLSRGGMESVFLQDANSLVMRPHLLADILTYLKRRFPSIARITSYARAHTVARMALQDLLSIREAGLNRLHIGLESGSDEVLERVRKGVTKQQHIEAGLKAKEAGMELSEYYMPGLGGSDLLEVHALESADALSRINPHFIRLRTLAIPASAPLFDDQAAGRFVKAPEIEVLRELRLFLENLRGVTAYLASDHVLNLFPELEGQLPGDRGRMIAILDAFLEMDREQQALYQLGRRLGIFSALRDLEDPRRNAAAQEAAVRLGLSPDNVDALTGGIVAHFI